MTGICISLHQCNFWNTILQFLRFILRKEHVAPSTTLILQHGRRDDRELGYFSQGKENDWAALTRLSRCRWLMARLQRAGLNAKHRVGVERQQEMIRWKERGHDGGGHSWTLNVNSVHPKDSLKYQVFCNSAWDDGEHDWPWLTAKRKMHSSWRVKARQSGEGRLMEYSLLLW